jgi:hypothetical protein
MSKEQQRQLANPSHTKTAASAVSPLSAHHPTANDRSLT